jgi:hypothetical protein
VIAVSLVLINTLLMLYDRSFDLITIMLVPYLIFEASIGPWLMIRGIGVAQEQAKAPRLGESKTA